jgi:DNA-binding response OmpR family regulator
MNEQQATTRSSGGPHTSAVERKRVLVVDDDLPLRGMLAAALDRKGFQVILAGDGAEAERAIVVHSPHIILLDLMMPEVNGWDLLQRLKETGRLGAVPVIVISAHLRIEPEALLQMGAAALLAKPFDLDELMTLIEHLAP